MHRINRSNSFGLFWKSNTKQNTIVVYVLKTVFIWICHFGLSFALTPLQCILGFVLSVTYLYEYLKSLLFKNRFFLCQSKFHVLYLLVFLKTKQKFTDNSIKSYLILLSKQRNTAGWKCCFSCLCGGLSMKM